MRQHMLDLDGAMDWACKYHEGMQRRFLTPVMQVPSFGDEVDRDVSEYIFHLANWVQGNTCCSYECGRYFGDKGLEVRRTGVVALLPKVKRTFS